MAPSGLPSVPEATKLDTRLSEALDERRSQLDRRRSVAAAHKIERNSRGMASRKRLFETEKSLKAFFGNQLDEANAAAAEPTGGGDEGTLSRAELWRELQLQQRCVASMEEALHAAEEQVRQLEERMRRRDAKR